MSLGVTYNLSGAPHLGRGLSPVLGTPGKTGENWVREREGPLFLPSPHCAGGVAVPATACHLFPCADETLAPISARLGRPLPPLGILPLPAFAVDPICASPFAPFWSQVTVILCNVQIFCREGRPVPQCEKSPLQCSSITTCRSPKACGRGE